MNDPLLNEETAERELKRKLVFDVLNICDWEEIMDQGDTKCIVEARRNESQRDITVRETADAENSAGRRSASI